MKLFRKLDETVRRLRDPRQGCPWDKKQTSKSLLPYFLEEVYEFIEAVEKEDEENIKEELGDLLLHLTFQSQLYEDENKFDMNEVEERVVEKLIYRHPHVFNDLKVESVDEIKRNWEELKKKKKEKKSVLSGVPDSLPALLRGQRVQEKAASVGFDWEDTRDVWLKVKEEVEEIEGEIRAEDHEKMEEELGDLFFALINYCRHHKLSAEFVAQRGVNKFMERFKKVEKEAGENLTRLSVMELEKIWRSVKKKEKTC